MTLFLDLDGPVLDVAARYHAVHRDVLASFGLDAEDLDSYWSRRRFGSSEAQLLRASGMTDAQIESSRARRSEMLEQSQYISLDRAWPEVAGVLASVARRLPIVIVTLRRQAAPAIEQIKGLGVWDLLGGFVHRSAGQGTSKSDAVRGAGMPVRSGDWFCGDTEIEVAAARELGISSCAVSFGMFSSERLHALGPDILLESPEQLATWLEVLA